MGPKNVHFWYDNLMCWNRVILKHNIGSKIDEPRITRRKSCFKSIMNVSS
jgi:hypothetical protein